MMTTRISFLRIIKSVQLDSSLARAVPLPRYLLLLITIALAIALGVGAAFAGPTYTGETILRNTSGRELLVDNDEGDSTITFHDAGSAWFSIGQDFSSGRIFRINGGGELGAGEHFAMHHNGRIAIGHTSWSDARLDVKGWGETMRLRTTSGPQVSHVHYGADGDWYIRSADTWGKVILQDTGGNVGIGTTSPDYRLDVNGTLRAKEVIVATNWSDFVFEDDYALPTLEEVESHIKEHGRLPGVPAATEIQANGLKVAEAQTIMMQKIEELTLYMLELKRENESLRHEVDSLRRSVTSN